MAADSISPIVADYLRSLDRGAVRDHRSFESFIDAEGREAPNGELSCQEVRQHVDGRGRRSADGVADTGEILELTKALRAKFGPKAGAEAMSVLMPALLTPGGTAGCSTGIRYEVPATPKGSGAEIPRFALAGARLQHAFDHFPPELEAQSGLRFVDRGGAMLDVLLFRSGKMELWVGNEGGTHTKSEPTPGQARAIAQRLQDFLAREHESVMAYRDQPSWDELGTERSPLGKIMGALYKRAGK